MDSTNEHACHNVSPGVIFDLDGTLADTLLDITGSLNVTLASAGLAPLPPDRVRPLIGEGLPVLLSKASGITDEPTLRQWVQRFVDHYRAHLLDNTRLYPGIAQTLHHLAAAGCPLAVLSNKAHELTQTICRRLLADWPFRDCLGAAEDRPRKPDPTAALMLAQTLNRTPQQVIFVGDSGVDIATAINAGMQPLGVTWGFRQTDELRQAGAHNLLDKPEDLANAILR